MGHPTDANGDSTSTYPDGYFNNDSKLIERLTNAITNGITATSAYGTKADFAANRILLTITALPTETESSTKYYNGISWENCSVKRYNGISWENIKFKQYDGSKWV